MHHPLLFSPLRLNGHTLKNRVVFGAHTANMSDNGLPGEQHLHYYLERARGGAAMIVVEPVPVHRTGVLTRGNFRADDDAVIPGFRHITAACKEHGTVMIQQLYHVGGHGDFDNSLAPYWSPSGFPSFHDACGSHAMSAEEVEEVIEGHVRAAQRAWRAGFDGIEIMAAYNALMEQFWLPLTNRRDDRFGGAFENRMRFSHEIYTRIRKATGDGFILGLAVSIDPHTEAAMPIEELQEIARYHDRRRLVDYLSVGTGSYFDYHQIIPHSLYEDLSGVAYAARLRPLLRHTLVQAESRITTPERAEAVLAAGAADLVSIVRGQIADPRLAAKAEQGQDTDIRPCISCNQGCWGRRHRDYHISCLVNPSAGREYLWGGNTAEPVATPRTIAVIGAGPAGLETARVAAARGHRVTLYEKQSQAGGLFRLAGIQPSRGAILDLVSWHCRQLDQLGVRLRLNTEVSADMVLGADAVVIATGACPDRDGFQRALPHRERLPGVEQSGVITVAEALQDPAAPGPRVLVLDDNNGWPGAGTALLLAEHGHRVTILSAAPMIAAALVLPSADVAMRARLRRHGVAFIVESALLEWDRGRATVRSNLDGATRTLDFDSLVLCTTARAPQPDGLGATLAQRGGVAVHTVGDCVAQRHALAAFYEGRRLGMEL